jgi:dihydropteroate synthase
MAERLSVPPVRVGERWLTFEAPVLMGVVNVTPDSFSAGHTTDAAAAIAQGVALWREGADILDVGGEATNPRAEPIGAAQEWARIEPVLRGLAAATGAILSVDTTKAEVAARAVAAGAAIVNDISGGRFDPAMIDTVAELARTRGVAYVAGHLRGRSISEVFSAEPSTAMTAAEVIAELAALVAALPPGVRDATIVDPGLGRSEERRVGKECRRLCRSRWSPYH